MNAAAYRRVSSEEQAENFSLDAQRHAIERYCQDHHWDLVADYCDAGFSARSDDRPAFREMIAAAKAGQFRVVVVHRLDRFSRNREHWAIYRALLKAANVRLVSISEPADDDAAGTFVTGILEVASEFYSIRLSEETTKGKKQRAEDGFWNGDPPCGYCRGLCANCVDPNGPDYCDHVGEDNRSDGRILIPHPRDSKAVREAFDLYASGRVSDRDVASVLNSMGYRTNRKHTIARANLKRPGGPGPFTRDTVTGLLRNPFYIGFTSYHGRLIRGKHEAIIAPELFERVQRLRRVLACNPRRQDSHGELRPYPLTGLLYCEDCGRPLYGQYAGGSGGRYYRDSGVVQGVSDCSPSHVRADEIEQWVTDFVSAIRLPDDWRKRITVYLTGDATADQLEARRTDLAIQRKRVTDLYRAGLLPQEEMETEAARLQLEEQQLHPEELRRCEEAAAVLLDFAEIWKEATHTERREMLQLMFDRIQVKAGRVTAIQPRASFYPLVVTTGATGIAPAVAIIPPEADDA